MSIETHRIKIDGDHYKAFQLGGRKGLNVLKKLTKIVGPSLLGLALQEGKEKAILSSIDKTASYLFNSIDSPDADEVIEALLSTVEVQEKGSDYFLSLSEEINFDKHFSGKLERLFEVLAFTIKINYGSFTKLAGRIGSLAGQLQNK